MPAAERVLLVAIVLLAGLGVHRLVAGERAGLAAFAGVLYAINPFVYDRLLTGQWFLLLGYAVLPWALRALIRTLRGERRAPWMFAALFALTGIAAVVVCLVVTIYPALLASRLRPVDKLRYE